MQRLRSLRRSMSRSSRKSGGSSNSASSSPRASQDTPSRGTPSSASSTPDIRTSTSSVDHQETADPPSPSPAPRATRVQPDTSQPAGSLIPANVGQTADDHSRASLASLSTSISEAPVIVEPPSPSPPATTEADIGATSTTATGREVRNESFLQHRKAAEADQQIQSKIFDEEKEDPKSTSIDMPIQRPWLLFAVASGGFAALNGAFAKFIATFFSKHLQISVEFTNPVIRGTFFLLNILSNAIMWALFTRALTAHTSATKVSLINTSANFLVTAILGALIFREVLPPGWFGGAALLVLGTLIIGRDRQNEAPAESTASADEETIGDINAPGASTPPRRPHGLGLEKSQTRSSEREPLLAGDETEGVRPDGEGE